MMRPGLWLTQLSRPASTAAAPAAPTLLSAEIAADGETLTLAFSEAVTGAFDGMFIVDPGAISTTGPGTGGDTATQTFALSPLVIAGAVVTLSYVPGAVVSVATGLPLAEFSGFPITNLSEVPPE